MVVTAGNINDTTMLEPVLDSIVVPRNGRPGRPRKRPDRVLADKGYSSRKNRSLLRGRGIPHTIPEPKDQKANRVRRGSSGGRPVGFDWETTSTATPSNAASTASSSGADWPCAPTSTPTTTKPDSYSASSSCGPQHDPRDTP